MARNGGTDRHWRTVRRLGIVVLAAASLGGCRGNAFMARRFDNFTAHYNKFYNANRTFREQERRLSKGDEKIDADRYLAVFEIPNQRGRSAEFEKVITKSADLLRNHPRSKWVDDALMLIGKSYFYQSNYVGAEQKFYEILNLETSLKDEAQFWLARTLVAGQSTSASEDVIGEALAKEDLEKEWRSLFLLLRGDLRTDEGDWPAAIADIEKGIEDAKDGDTAARAYFLLGQLYETEGLYEESVSAYKRVQSKKPLYELSYAALFGEIRVLGLFVDPQAALAKLERAMRDNKHFQNRHHLRYLHARILAAAGQPLAAKESFFDQLYPPDQTKKTNLRGEVHYRLGGLYRDYLSDFYQAGVHFDTASSVLRTLPAQNQRFAPDAITYAKETANTFTAYRQSLDEVTRMDSLLHLGSLDQADFDSAVVAVRAQLAEAAERIQEELERRRTETRFRQAAGDTDSRRRTPDQVAGQVASTGAYGFLNHKDLQRVQEAFLNFKEAWGDRPLVPGWRREEVVVLARQEAQAAAKDGENPDGEVLEIEKVRFLPPVDISEVPRDSASQAAMRAERAEARYRLANVLFLSIGLPDSAAKWYRLVIDEDYSEPVAQRALYAMAEIHDAVGDDEAAVRTFERVIDEYPDSEFAARARSRLGIEVETEAVVSDSLEMANARYDEAYQLWKEGDLSTAIDRMTRTAADYPDLDVAAKALLAAATIFIDKAHLEGGDLYGPIPLGDSLFSTEEVEAAIAAAAPPPEEVVPPSDSVSRHESEIDSVQVDSVEVPDRGAIDSETAVRDLADDALREEEPTSQAVITAQAESRRRLEEGLLIRSETVAVADDEVSFRVAAKTNPAIEVPPDSTATATTDTTAIATVDSTTTATTDSTTIATISTPPRAKVPNIEWAKPEYSINGLIPIPLTLYTLYGALGEQFGDTPYGERAVALRQGLVEVRTAVAVAQLAALEEDETAIPVQQASPAPEAAAVDSMLVAPPEKEAPQLAPSDR